MPVAVVASAEMKSIAVALVVLLGSLMHGVESRTCICGATSEGGDVNVRTCASTDCAVVGLISPGDCADYLGADGVWYNIDFQGTVQHNTTRYL